MDRAMELRHLEEAERHVAQGGRHIAEQEDRVADLARLGADTTVARQLLSKRDQGTAGGRRQPQTEWAGFMGKCP